MTNNKTSSIRKVIYYKSVLILIFCAVLATVLFLCVVPTKADEIASGTCGDNLTWTLDGDGTLTISGEGEMEDFNNSASYPWYLYKDSITRVVINSGVENIGGYAFYEYSKINDLEISNGVSRIGSMAFYGCSIISLVIPESVTRIQSNTFACCNSLEEIIVDDNNEIFNSRGECNAIIETERNLLIRGCNNTILPDSVLLIGDYAFSDCIGLDNIKIPDNVISIGNWSFLGCSSLESIDIPNSVTSIGQSAFSNCSSLENVKITDSVTYIGHSVFSGCSSLTSFIIPNGITSIGSHMFNRCSSLTYIFIPDSVTKIGGLAFSGCSSLSNIIIPDTVTTIEANAFRDCSSLTALEIPDSVESLGSSAFYGCRNLESIVIPDNTSIINSRELFHGCQSLSSIRLPDGLTSIGERMFYNCTSLTEISIPDSVTDIGNMSFCKCSSLININIPKSVTSISEYAFASCSSLIEIEIPDSVTNMDSQCLFSGCSSLVYIKLPDNITNIGYSAFQGCSSLLGIEIPDGVISIESQAFYGCSSLNKVVIPNSITSIGAKAFRDCSSLKYIELSNTTSSIGHWAFHDSGIEDVYFDGTKEDWDHISGSEDQEYVNLFTLEDLDISLSLDISLKDVKGGAVVTIGGADSIYYTLDGSIPCTVSVPYEGTFILDKPGEYFINARAFDLEQGTYSEIATKYVCIEQSEKPVISERNGQVIISEEGDIYYSLDLAEDPSTSSYKYTGPLSFDKTAVVKARCIEQGKAASEVTGYIVIRGETDSIVFPYETYSFPNKPYYYGYSDDPNDSFLNSPIPTEEELYSKTFGRTKGRLLWEKSKVKDETVIRGLCYGMSVTALLFHRGLLHLEDYSDTASWLNELIAPSSPDSMLTALIKRFQISQQLEENRKFRSLVDEGGTKVNSDESGNRKGAIELLNAVESGFQTGGDPVILIVWNQTFNMHAVVPYRIEKISEENPNGKIYVYDCNYPDEEKYIEYKILKNGQYSFNYENGQYSAAVSYDLLSTVISGLGEGIDIRNAYLYAEGTEEKGSMLLSTDSDDIMITDLDTGNPAEISKYYATDDMLAGSNLYSLACGRYRITNNDKSKDRITITVSTDDDYHNITVNDPDAVVEVKERNGKVYFCVTSEFDTEIVSSVMSGKGNENNISLTSSYAEIYSTTDRTVVVRTKAATAVINGKIEEMVNDELDPEYYIGAAVNEDAEKGARWYSEDRKYSLATDITELPDADFNLTVLTTGGDENVMLFVASYSSTGRQIGIKGTKMTAGRTRYAFSISQNAATVKVYMLTADGGVPVIRYLSIQ